MGYRRLRSRRPLRLSTLSQRCEGNPGQEVPMQVILCIALAACILLALTILFLDRILSSTASSVWWGCLYFVPPLIVLGLQTYLVARMMPDIVRVTRSGLTVQEVAEAQAASRNREYLREGPALLRRLDK